MFDLSPIQGLRSKAASAARTNLKNFLDVNSQSLRNLRLCVDMMQSALWHLPLIHIVYLVHRLRAKKADMDAQTVPSPPSTVDSGNSEDDPEPFVLREGEGEYIAEICENLPHEWREVYERIVDVYMGNDADRCVDVRDGIMNHACVRGNYAMYDGDTVVEDVMRIVRLPRRNFEAHPLQDIEQGFETIYRVVDGTAQEPSEWRSLASQICHWIASQFNDPTFSLYTHVVPQSFAASHCSTNIFSMDTADRIRSKKGATADQLLYSKWTAQTGAYGVRDLQLSNLIPPLIDLALQVAPDVLAPQILLNSLFCSAPNTSGEGLHLQLNDVIVRLAVLGENPPATACFGFSGTDVSSNSSQTTTESD